MSSITVNQFASTMRKHVSKIDEAKLLTSSEKDHRKHEFRLLVIDFVSAFGTTEASLLKSCNL
jgi:hypothetical protein